MRRASLISSCAAWLDYNSPRARSYGGQLGNFNATVSCCFRCNLATNNRKLAFSEPLAGKTHCCTHLKRDSDSAASYDSIRFHEADMFDNTMPYRAQKESRGAKSRYRPPLDVREAFLTDLLRDCGREVLDDKQLNLLRSESIRGDVPLYFSGDLSLLDRPCVAVVGSRDLSEMGRKRAARLARELAHDGFVVVSGLAAGVDATAHSEAISAGGSTIGVIGTPLDKAYPAANADLQKEIYENHLLISPFASGEQTFKSSFPKRNRVMAALSDATVIVEASDTSGTLHQAAECVRLKRWLFIAKSLAESENLTWPAKFLKEARVRALSETRQIIEAVLSERS